MLNKKEKIMRQVKLKKPLKQLIQKAFKKAGRESESEAVSGLKMTNINAEKAKFEKDLNEKTAKTFGKAASSGPSANAGKKIGQMAKIAIEQERFAKKMANDNAAKYNAPPATVSKPNTYSPKNQNVPFGSGSKSKSLSESSSRYKNKK